MSDDEKQSIEPDLHATTTRESLLDAVRFASMALPGRPPMQVLLGVMLDARQEDGTLRVSAFDYEMSAVAHASAPGAGGRALVPGRLLADMLRVLPKQSGVVLTMSANRSTLLLAGDGVVYNVPLLPIADYPAIPTLEGTVIEMPAKTLQTLGRVCRAAGRDDTLPVLTGVLLDGEDGALTAAATDRYRLGVQKTDVPWDRKVLIPAKTLDRLVKAFAKSPIPVQFTVVADEKYGDASIKIECGDRCVTTRLLDGEFPRYRSLIPNEVTTTITLPREETIEAVVKAGVMVSRNAPVRLTIDGTVLTIEGGSEHVTEGNARATVEGVEIKEGEQLSKVALNDRYLLDGLGVLTGERATVKIQGPMRPHIFQSDEDPGFTYLLMPVRLAG